MNFGLWGGGRVGMWDMDVDVDMEWVAGWIWCGNVCGDSMGEDKIMGV